VLEAWEWLTDDPFIRVVEATLDNESEGWQVLVGVSDLCETMRSTLSSSDGSPQPLHR